MDVELTPWHRTPYWLQPVRANPSGNGYAPARELTDEEKQELRELELRRVPLGFQPPSKPKRRRKKA
jgi:hypothetical protein